MFRHFSMTHVHIRRERNSTSSTFVGGESHRGDAYIKGRRHFFLENLVLFCFILLYLSFYGALSYIQYLCFVILIASYLCIGHAYILMLLCFISYMFGGSFALLCDHYGHFHMTNIDRKSTRLNSSH